MKIDDMFYWIERHRSRIRFFLTPALLLMIAGVYAFVLLTGGIKYVFSHSMYLPIALAAIAFGVKGGVAAALLGGLPLDPFTQLIFVPASRRIQSIGCTGLVHSI